MFVTSKHKPTTLLSVHTTEQWQPKPMTFFDSGRFSILPKSSFRSLLTHTHTHIRMNININNYIHSIYMCVCVSSCVSSLKLYPFLCVLEGSLLDFYSYHFFVFQRFPYFDTHSYHIHSHTFPKKHWKRLKKNIILIFQCGFDKKKQTEKIIYSTYFYGIF